MKPGMILAASHSLTNNINFESNSECISIMTFLSKFTTLDQNIVFHIYDCNILSVYFLSSFVVTIQTIFFLVIRVVLIHTQIFVLCRAEESQYPLYEHIELFDLVPVQWPDLPVTILHHYPSFPNDISQLIAKYLILQVTCPPFSL